MNNRPIIIQGAMDIEVEYLKSKLENMEELTIHDYKFYKGCINNYPVIISQTEIGMINGALATIIAIENFNPYCIINQGTAGAHKEYIHKNDIIVGKDSANINHFATEGLSSGIEPLKWDFKRTRLANEQKKLKLESDEELYNIFSNNNVQINIHFGTIGSGDVFDREVDRIKQISDIFDTLCEDMETAAVYTVCHRTNTKVIGVRIISNNELTGEEYDESIAIECQKYVYDKIVEMINLGR